MALYLQKLESPSLKDVGIGPVLVEKMKIWKVYGQTDGQKMDNMQS